MNLNRLTFVFALGISMITVAAGLFLLADNSGMEYSMSSPTAISIQNPPRPTTLASGPTAAAHSTITNLGTFTQVVTLPTPNAASLAQAEEYRIIRSFSTLPGKIIAQGNNTTPTGNGGLLTYRVEEVVLPAPVTLPIKGKSPSLDRVWRLVVTGTNIRPYIGSLFYTVWLDETFLSTAGASKDGTTLTSIVYDLADLRNGAAISISEGKSYSRGMVLPEKLMMPAIR
jgi:hypothetical protein